MQINRLDNVEVCLTDGQKYALRDMAPGEPIIKYGNPIGHATEWIPKGAHVHTHNMKTNLSGTVEYHYTPFTPPSPGVGETPCFMGYLRENGEVGIRNDIFIVNTVGCVNHVAQRLAAETGAVCFPHPFGCSQLGEDQTITQQILRGIVRHPNAGGVLVLGLGCENNHIGVFREMLGDVDENRVKFLNCQDVADEIAAGIRLIRVLQATAEQDRRQPLPVSKLRIGLKCGGSDGYSGITANPLVGQAADRLIAMGASCVLTEVPEMFGAEHLLMARAESEAVFHRIVRLINDFKAYYQRHHQVIYENPSPGNKAGGITTLEEKSLGCVQKAGSSAVVDVLDYGDTVRKSGLSLLNGPGNDIVAMTNLFAAGVHLILFTTGRGTPVGSGVPTIKISSNRELAARKPGWIDFDASPMLDGVNLAEALLAYILQVANGQKTQNERHGYKEIAIFKDGVTL